MSSTIKVTAFAIRASLLFVKVIFTTCLLLLQFVNWTSENRHMRLIALLLLLVVTCQAQSPGTCKYVSSFSTNPPTSLQACDWIAYAKFPVVIFAWILVTGLIISLITTIGFCMRRCCGLCGSSVASEPGYKKEDQRLVSIMYIIVCVFIVLLCLGAIAGIITHTVASDKVIVTTTNTLRSTFDQAMNYLGGNLTKKAHTISEEFLGAVDETVSLIEKVQPAVASLKTVGQQLSNADQIPALSVAVNGNIMPLYWQIASYLTQLNSEFTTSGHNLGMTFSAPSVIDVTSSSLPDMLVSAMNTTVTDGSQIGYNVMYLEQVLKAAHDAGSDPNLINSVHKLGNISAIALDGDVGRVFDWIKTNIFPDEGNGKPEQITRGVTIAIHILGSIFFVLVAIVFLLGVCCAVAKQQNGMRAQACCSWLLIMFVTTICALCFLVFTLVHVPYCQKNVRSDIFDPARLSDPIIGNYNVSKALNYIHGTIKCQGNTTFFELFEINQNTSRIKELSDQFDSKIKELMNVADGSFMDANTDLTTNMKNGLHNVDKALNDLQYALSKYDFTTLRNNLNSFSSYSNFSLASFDDLIKNVNKITNNVWIKDSTTGTPKQISLNYGRLNISTFDVTTYPMNSLVDPTQQQQLNTFYANLTTNEYANKYSAIVNIQTKGNNLLDNILTTRTFISNYIPSGLSAASKSQNTAEQVLLLIPNVKTSLLNVYISSEQLTKEMKQLVDLAVELLTGPQCGYIGQAFDTIDGQFCGMMYYSVPSVGLLCFILAIMLAIAYPIALVSSKRFVKGYSDYEIDLHHQINYGAVQRDGYQQLK
jgi:hypothetical protein